MNKSVLTEKSAVDKYGYVIKTCKICGGTYGKSWLKHWNTLHSGRVPEIWLLGGEFEQPGALEKYQRQKLSLTHLDDAQSMISVRESLVHR